MDIHFQHIILTLKIDIPEFFKKSSVILVFSKRVQGMNIYIVIIQKDIRHQLKKKLMEDFNSKFYEADRLIRTEASHAYNSAALESYKQAGCTKVEYLAEDDCCEECEPYSGQVYLIEDAPTIPVHPNCRCTYLPILEV